MISIIIPAFNEEGNILKVIDEVKKLDLKKEIIVVDDGSIDKTGELVKTQKDVKLIQHEINQGRGAAVKTGIANSSGDIIYIQDADMEQFPSDIPKLVEPILSNEAEVVYGCRFPKGRRPHNMSLIRIIGNHFFAFLGSFFFKQNLSDIYTGSKCYKKEVVNRIDLKASGFEQEVELLAKISQLGIKIKEVSINYSSRQSGSSKMKIKDGVIGLIALSRYYLQSKFSYIAQYQVPEM